MNKVSRWHQVGFSLLLFLLVFSIPAVAQDDSFVVSRSRDLSGQDVTFERTDTLYVFVMRTDIDFTAIDEMDFRLQPESDGEGIEGHFTNNLDGSYTAAIALDQTNPQVSAWQLRVEIKDNADNEFKARVPITIGAPNGTPPPPGTGREMDFEGRIREIQENSLRVHDVWIVLRDSTEIVGDNHETLSLTDLFVGLEIEVLAIHTEDDHFVAKRIVARISDAVEGEVEVEGVITEMDSASLVVDGLHFMVNDSTEIRDGREEPTVFDSLRTGLFVGVKGNYQPDGTLLAERIKVDAEEDRHEGFAIAGPVDSLTDRSISVAGFDFLVDDETEFEGDDHLEIGRAGLQVGALVEVKGEYRSDGLLWAVKVRLEETVGTEIEEHGTIESLGDRTLTVNGLVFEVDSTTVFLDGERHLTDFAALEIDLEVEVKAIQFPDGSFLALRVKIKKEKSERIKQSGRIEFLTANTLTVLGTEFSVDSTSQVLDRDKNPITLADLQVGMWVKVKAVRYADGTLFAEEVRVREHAGEEVSVTALIDTLWESSMSVAGLTFVVTERTIVLDASEQHIGFADLQTGALVSVKGKRMPDGTNLALRIRLRDQSDGFVEIEGSIAAVSGDTLLIGNSELLLNADTQYFDQDNNPVAAFALVLGDFVEVKASVDSNGSFLVHKLKLEEAASLQGTVEDTLSNGADKANENHFASSSTVTTQFVLLNTTVLVDENTLIVGPFNVPLDVSVISSGAVVDAQGTLTGTGELLASTVQVLSYNSATSVNQNDDSPVPELFSLEQNYPNPFNPETTIRFQIPNRSHVIIKIYNLLGQQIQTLVNGEFEAGVQTVHWNGKDDRGNNVSSGIYFYKIQAGTFNKVMKMTLVR